MRRIMAIPVLTLLLVALAAPLPVGAQQARIGEAEVTMLDPGEEPRQLLRYEFVEGSTEALEMNMGMSMSMSMDGLDMMTFDMPMSMTTTTTVTDVYDDGSARVEYVISDWDLGDMGGLVPDTAELDAAMEMMDGFGGWMVIDTRGAMLDYGIDLPEDIPADLTAQSEQVATEVAVLPEEPVGVGARWEAAMTTAAAGIGMEMISTSEIVSMDGGLIVLDQTFGSDVSPDLGGLMGLEDLLGDSFMETELTGGGTSELRLDRVSQPSELEVLVAMTMGIDDGESLTEVAFDMVMDVVATLVD